VSKETTMSTFQVTKAFTTVNRRFAAGDTVRADEIEGSLSADGWQERGFLEPVRDKPATEPTPPEHDDDL